MACEAFWGSQPHRPKAAGMRPGACGPQGPPPAPVPRRRSSPGSDARHRSPDLIHGFAEYALSFPYIFACLSLSLCSLDNHFCTIVRARMPALGLTGLCMVIIGIRLQTWMQVMVDVDVDV